MPIVPKVPCKFLLKLTDLTKLTCKNLHENCEKSENSYSAERLFYKFSCISQKNVVSLHAKLRAKAKKEQAGYEYEDKDR